MILIPLLGLQYLLTPFQPDQEEMPKFYSAFAAVQALITSTQVNPFSKNLKYILEHWKYYMTLSLVLIKSTLTCEGHVCWNNILFSQRGSN